jgi:L-asparaginase type II
MDLLAPRAPIGRRVALPTSTALLLLSAALCAQEIPRYSPPPPLPDDPSALPTVVVMSMGGTIASRGAPRLNITNYGGKSNPRVEPQDWYDDLPELAGIANIRLEDQRAPQDRPPGIETHEDWARVARRLNELAADAAVDGIVVTHGTNTMAETAYYMNLTVKTDKPIVFVGAQRPWTGLSGDGPRNLYDAVRVAASRDAWRKGVLHAMNQFINTARDVDKTSAYRVDTFKGVDVGAIGFADPDKVVFYREPTRRHTAGSEFAGVDYAELPKVEVAFAYRDAPGYVIDAMVEHGIEGLVVEGTGAGSPTSGQNEAIERARGKGVIVVATARTQGGRVQDTPRRREAGIVPGDNLVPEKARILLQLALTKTDDPSEVERIFNEY